MLSPLASDMKTLLFLSIVVLTLSSPPAGAQAGNAPSPTVRLEQLAVGFRQRLSRTNQERMAEISKARSESSTRSAAHDMGIGAGIGTVVGIGAGVVASRRKQSNEVDIGTTAYVLLGAVSGAVLGALAGLVVHSLQ
jgi:hypothetical protein